MEMPFVVYQEIREPSVVGRYVTSDDLEPILKKISTTATVRKIGESVLGKPIQLISLGSGKHKVLLWSQMHGNESTTTKAVLDLLRFFQKDDVVGKQLLERCTLQIIPMLNPDGAEAYTRVNANQVDLNRDAQKRSQPESRLLRKVYEDFKPDFCFNLHDQRTIFNVGSSSKPATVSFLAPASDEERSVSENRGLSMRLIAAMNRRLQTLIPGQIGRYDDAFNPNCVGDTFQMLGTPTVLFEAGHFPEDYRREETRKYIFEALLQALYTIATDGLHAFELDTYYNIPENGKQFYDVLIKNPDRINDRFQKGQLAAILYKEVLTDRRIHFKPELITLEGKTEVFGHVTFDCEDISELQLLKQASYWLLVS